MVHYSLELVDGPLELVVHDRVVEIAGLFQLPAGDLEALLDHSARLGGAGSQAPFELFEGGNRDEDGHCAGLCVADRPRSFRLQLEHAALARGEDARDLGTKRAVPAGDVDDVLEELVLFDPLEELLLAEEVVLPAVDLTLAAGPRGRRDGPLKVGAALQ